jgi:flagellar hook assembly protein FlgD
MDLSLPRAANVELTVFDVQGRRVWGESRAYDAGRWTLSWTGRDDAGQRAPRGIYLARVNVSGGPTLVRRIALMP